MNRRSFIGGFAAALAGFAVLPPATTYTRLWKAVRPVDPKWIPNPEWVNAPYQIYFWNAGPFEFTDFSEGKPLRWIVDRKTGTLSRVPPVIKV